MKIATSSRRATSDAAVVFACDGAYTKCALMAADQLARLTPERDFDICLCSTEVLPDVRGIADPRRCRIDPEGALAGLRLDARRSEATYLRLLLPAAFADDYRRLLYLDSDVFIQGGDFGRLLRLDIGGKAVAAVRDNTQWRTPGRRIDSFRANKLPAAPYFNDGVLLIDVGSFNAGQVLEGCLDFARAHPLGMTHLDQDLINGALMGDWAELSPLWNWQYTWASRMFEAMIDANVVHFIGPKKPWNNRGGELPPRFRRAYRDFFERNFPDEPPLPSGGTSAAAGDPAFLRRMLVKHLLSAGKMTRYLARFATDLTVLPAQ